MVSQVGAGVRLLRHRGRELVLGYGADEVRPRYRGALLAPWPNRVVDGRYSFAGTTHQLDLTEPERGHALHGLVCWQRFDVLDRGETWVELGHTIVPRTGYPFAVELVVRYTLSDAGLTTTVRARNTAPDPAPYGVGPHPYLVAGPGRVDEWMLTLPAGDVLDPARLGLAVEPMTCPPDAFNSGTDLVVLEPTAEHVAEWTILAV